jgi:hypothetical protein
VLKWQFIDALVDQAVFGSTLFLKFYAEMQ